MITSNLVTKKLFMMAQDLVSVHFLFIFYSIIIEHIHHYNVETFQKHLNATFVLPFQSVYFRKKVVQYY